jgi:hypothetical protein
MSWPSLVCGLFTSPDFYRIMEKFHEPRGLELRYLYRKVLVELILQFNTGNDTDYMYREFIDFSEGSDSSEGGLDRWE